MVRQVLAVQLLMVALELQIKVMRAVKTFLNLVLRLAAVVVVLVRLAQMQFHQMLVMVE